MDTTAAVRAFLDNNPKIPNSYRGCQIQVEKDWNLGDETGFGFVFHREDSVTFGEGTTSSLFNPLTGNLMRRGEKVTEAQAKSFAKELEKQLKARGWKSWSDRDALGELLGDDFDFDDPDAIERVLGC